MKATNGLIALVISISLLAVGCGKKEESLIDKGIKTTVETGLKVVKTVDDANNANTRFSVMKDNKDYAKFELLKLGIPYVAACTVMTSPPSQNEKNQIVDVRICSWDLENNVKIECEFRNGKLFRKKFNSNQIFVKEPFTKEQFNQIREGDIFSAVKQKLNNQDGYLCEQMEGIGSSFDTYMWRNPDGSAAKVHFSGSLFFKKEFINEHVSLTSNANTAKNNQSPAEKSAVSTANQQGAIDANTILPSFHQAITAKQYWTAYNYLGPDMQRYVGGYDKFANGYATTISSKPTNMNPVSMNSDGAVIEYILEAKDNINGAIIEQRFQGKATIKKINGNWKIVENTAKKVSNDNGGSVNSGQTGIITATEVRMRQYNNTNSEILGYFNKGERVTILSNVAGWYKVQRSDNSIGWVLGDFCKPQ